MHPMKWSWRLTVVVAADLAVAAATAGALPVVYARFSGSEVRGLLLSDVGAVDVAFAVAFGLWACWFQRHRLGRGVGKAAALQALALPGVGLTLLMWHLLRATPAAVARGGYYLYAEAGFQLSFAAIGLAVAAFGLVLCFLVERGLRRSQQDVSNDGGAV